jgi:hypothetical protein
MSIGDFGMIIQNYMDSTINSTKFELVSFKLMRAVRVSLMITRP